MLRIFYLCMRVSILFMGTFLVALIWLPNDETYDRSDDVLIQKNNGINGYKVNYYSRIQNSPFPPFARLPHYASRNVAMSGAKELGFTPFVCGDVGKTKINLLGFINLWVISTCIIYVTMIAHSFFIYPRPTVCPTERRGESSCSHPTLVQEIRSELTTPESASDSVKNESKNQEPIDTQPEK